MWEFRGVGMRVWPWRLTAPPPRLPSESDRNISVYSIAVNILMQANRPWDRFRKTGGYGDSLDERVFPHKTRILDLSTSAPRRHSFRETQKYKKAIFIQPASVVFPEVNPCHWFTRRFSHGLLSLFSQTRSCSDIFTISFLIFVFDICLSSFSVHGPRFSIYYMNLWCFF